MYKIVFTLKQHTPLIHFQHDQAGATLRATEVKPKLDRFIIEEITKLNGDKAKEKFLFCTTKKIKSGKVLIDNPDFNQNWYNLLLDPDNDHLAFDYKLAIYANDQFITKLKSKENWDGVQNPVYFANMGDSAPKHYSEAKSIDFTIRTFNKGIHDLFSENFICKFFLYNNFGSRHTKGLGSFYPEMINTKKIISQPYELLPKEVHYIEIASTKDYDIFATIDFFWKWLKSGINYNGYYKDSILKLFISSKEKYKWEKRKVKEHYLGLAPDSDLKYFIRAYMGLADNFTYKWVPKRKRRSGEVYTPIDITINIECQDNEVQRNSAPFLFVPFKENKNTKIFIIYQPSFHDKLDNKTFRLTIKKIEPVKVIVNIDKSHNKSKEITKRIFPDLNNAHNILKEAKAYLENIDDRKIKQKAVDLIEKANDFVEYFELNTANNLTLIKTINTSPVAPKLSGLLEFAFSNIGSTFDVKDFSGTNLIKANFLKNGK